MNMAITLNTSNPPLLRASIRSNAPKLTAHSIIRHTVGIAVIPKTMQIAFKILFILVVV